MCPYFIFFIVTPSTSVGKILAPPPRFLLHPPPGRINYRCLTYSSFYPNHNWQPQLSSEQSRSIRSFTPICSDITSGDNSVQGHRNHSNGEDPCIQGHSHKQNKGTSVTCKEALCQKLCEKWREFVQPEVTSRSENMNPYALFR